MKKRRANTKQLDIFSTQEKVTAKPHEGKQMDIFSTLEKVASIKTNVPEATPRVKEERSIRKAARKAAGKNPSGNAALSREEGYLKISLFEPTIINKNNTIDRGDFTTEIFTAKALSINDRPVVLLPPHWRTKNLTRFVKRKRGETKGQLKMFAR